jgi:hypothetical protein
VGDKLHMLEVAVRCTVVLGGWFLTIYSIELTTKLHSTLAAYV